MLRTGVDIIEVARIKRAAERHGERFYKRFYTLAECERCRGHYPALAARFAAKEAVAKALGTGIGDVCWTEIEITNGKRGEPVLVLHGAAARLADELDLIEWSISLAHTRENAIAFVVAMG